MKLHESENALFSMIFKIMSLNIMFRNSCKAYTAGMIGHKGENDFISHDLALSSEDEDASITPPKNFLKSNVEPECVSDNSSSFLPNSDDELAKYLDSELMPDANIKKKDQKTPNIYQ